ncbi:hypothetical protein MRX96_029402 [Rhipicephalus microplus]
MNKHYARKKAAGTEALEEEDTVIKAQKRNLRSVHRWSEEARCQNNVYELTPPDVRRGPGELHSVGSLYRQYRWHSYRFL